MALYGTTCTDAAVPLRSTARILQLYRTAVQLFRYKQNSLFRCSGTGTTGTTGTTVDNRFYYYSLYSTVQLPVGSYSCSRTIDRSTRSSIDSMSSKSIATGTRTGLCKVRPYAVFINDTQALAPSQHIQLYYGSRSIATATIEMITKFRRRAARASMQNCTARMHSLP